ncbi:Piezo-type mechanosensitive ion channel component 2 [Aphelenchoides bicaudatus]|nr:Piezo-type mechanosensitive ion channel component 2 [Aphelenchoides bicaudatus]
MPILEKFSSTSNVLASARIPISFVVIIIIWLTLMVIDRALYLCKSVQLKLYFQLFLVVMLHAWILGILPYVTKMSAVSNTSAAIFYVFKCLYLIVSAWQIRNGYPRLCIGNLLTHSYGLANYVLFMIYFNVPLLFEIRTIVDWTYTETVMPIFDFLKMENIYAQIFMVKCSRVLDETFPVQRGTLKPIFIKYPLGILIVIIIIGLALSPLIAYSIINRVGVQTGVHQVDLTISLQGYSPIYKMSAEEHDIINNAEYANNLTKLFNERFAMAFIKEYYTMRDPDIYYVNFRPESNVNWPISDASLQAMNVSLSNKAVNHTLEISLKLVRVSQSGKEPVVHTRTTSVILNSSMAEDILQAINTPEKSFNISNLLPYYLVAPTEGQIHDAEPLISIVKTKSVGLNTTITDSDIYSDAVFSFTNSSTSSFWTMQFKNKTSIMLPFNNTTYGSRDKQYIPMIFFVDRLVPPLFASIVSGGIIAMYAAFVLVAARILRSIIYSSPLEMIISEMPNPDRVLNLCLDIYLVREAKDFFLEEDLWAKLIFLFRSPETIIKWTRPKKSA